jgi:hypothetical protein
MNKIIATLALCLLPVAALADSDRVPPVTDPLTVKECGGCHMVFQPAFLPAASWQRLMDGLNDHFGEDASLPADKAAHIRGVLIAGAGTAHKFMRDIDMARPPLRITETPRFGHKHRKVSEQRWKAPDVVTRSNCPACHQAAARGDYEDD